MARALIGAEQDERERRARTNASRGGDKAEPPLRVVLAVAGGTVGTPVDQAGGGPTGQPREESEMGLGAKKSRRKDRIETAECEWARTDIRVIHKPIKFKEAGRGHAAGQRDSAVYQGI